MKKLIAIILAAVMCLSLLPVMAFAAETKVTIVPATLDSNKDFETVVQDGVTVSIDQGTSSNPPKHYSGVYRVYVGCILSIKAPAGNVLKSVVITTGDGKKVTDSCWECSDCSASITDGVATVTPVGENVATFAFTIKTQIRITKIEVTYAPATGHVCTYAETPSSYVKLDQCNHNEVYNCQDDTCEKDPYVKSAKHTYENGKCSLCDYKYEPDGVKTIPEALALVPSDGSTTAEMYIITGTIKSFAEGWAATNYGNLTIADENGNELYVYGLNMPYNGVNYGAMEVKPVVGDTIVIHTALGSYKGSPQAVAAWLMAINHEEHTWSDLVNNGDAGHSQTCSICGHVNASDHAFEIQQGLNGHYQLCVCGNKGAEEAHADGDDADKLCDKCGADLSCKHEKDWVANKDTTNHWIECPDCGAKDEVETHALTAKKDDTHHWTECGCGYTTAKVEHTLTAKKDDTHHWTECECGYATDKVAHTLTTKHNDTHHWTECACGYKSAEVAHTLTDNKCSCGYEAEPETSEPVEVPDDVKAILDAAYALEAEAELPYAVELTGKITAINTAWSDQYNNISVTITVPGCEDQPIMCFRLAGEGAKDLTIGDTITVSGTIMNYAGKSVQFKQGCELKSVVKGEEPAPVAPEDPKEIVDAAYELEAGTALPYSATLTGKIVSIDTEWSEQYKNITVTIQVAGCEDKPIMCYRLKGDEAAGLAVGDTITVTGNIKNYNGTVEFDSGCTLDKVVKNNVPATADNTIIAPVALLMALSAAGLAVLTLGKKKFF